MNYVVQGCTKIPSGGASFSRFPLRGLAGKSCGRDVGVKVKFCLSQQHPLFLKRA